MRTQERDTKKELTTSRQAPYIVLSVPSCTYTYTQSAYRVIRQDDGGDDA